MSQHIPAKLQPWIEARKRFHLSDAHVQMARELGMNPKKLGRLANHDQERWKLPLPEFIEYCYYKSFKKRRPDQVRSIERLSKEQKRKQAEKKKLKAERRANDACGGSTAEGLSPNAPTATAERPSGLVSDPLTDDEIPF